MHLMVGQNLNFLFYDFPLNYLSNKITILMQSLKDVFSLMITFAIIITVLVTFLYFFAAL